MNKTESRAAELPVHYRDVYQKMFLEEKDVMETARELGLTLDSVRAQKAKIEHLLQPNIILTINYKVVGEEDDRTEDFEFDTKKYWVGENNFRNVVSDYLHEKYGADSYNLYSVIPKEK